MKKYLREDLQAIATTAKLRLLRLHFEAGVGHIGGCLSCFDILLYLFHHKKAALQDGRIVLSKGHAAGALYTALWSVGLLSEEELESFHKDDSKLPGHPASGWHPAIASTTGSLGHGIGFAAGLAFAEKLKNGPLAKTVYVLTSDGEWQEGSTWEALNFAIHHQLNNLAILVDFNKLQGFGTIDAVASMGDLPERLAHLPVYIQTCDGHNFDDIHDCLAKRENEKPRVIIFNTVKGMGVSFMKNKMEWHYLPMREDQFRLACHEVTIIEG